MKMLLFACIFKYCAYYAALLLKCTNCKWFTLYFLMSLCVCEHTWCTANPLYADKNWKVWLQHKSIHKINYRNSWALLDWDCITVSLFWSIWRVFTSFLQGWMQWTQVLHHRKCSQLTEGVLDLNRADQGLLTRIFTQVRHPQGSIVFPFLPDWLKPCAYFHSLAEILNQLFPFDNYYYRNLCSLSNLLLRPKLLNF